MEKIGLYDLHFETIRVTWSQEAELEVMVAAISGQNILENQRFAE